MAWIFTPIAAGRNALRLVFAGNVFQGPHRTGEGVSAKPDSLGEIYRTLGIVLMFKGLYTSPLSFLLHLRRRIGIKYIQRCFAGGSRPQSQGLASDEYRGVFGATWLPE